MLSKGNRLHHILKVYLLIFFIFSHHLDLDAKSKNFKKTQISKNIKRVLTKFKDKRMENKILETREKRHAIITSVPLAGMFSHFITVLGALEKFERGEYTGVQIEFTEGLYIDKSYGENWWHYYFEPLNLFSPENVENDVFDSTEYSKINEFACSELTRVRAFELIQKYIPINPLIKNKIDEFIEQKFKDHYILGIHYRGTDKIIEARPIAYDEVFNVVTDLINSNDFENYKIFLATDSQNFLDFMLKAFPDKVISQDIYRSKGDESVHATHSSPHDSGKEALMDALLLSRCHSLIRTPSNLGLCSSFFNPTLPVILID